MAKKKSEIYGALWSACDELRGGMDASQYKDYVLTILFLKYISDKSKIDKDFLIEIPKGCSFDDIVKLKGDKEIGDKINKIISKIALQNGKNITNADFNDEEKLGSGKKLVDTLSSLIGIFQRDELDFSKNNASGDDILGDAYEYLMSNFAKDSGKSKGQFYTPAEVSRVMAKVIEADEISSAKTTLYDPTCGSGSLLLKVAHEAENNISIYGQESDITTVGLANMNMYLHGIATAEIEQGDTISSPKHLNEDGDLKTFDYVVANPPFSLKSWSNGLIINDRIAQDKYNRFEFGTPPLKNGDYAFLLHILKSMNTKAKGAVILPHGVLFRGNTEADIRQKIIEKKWIKGIISLPANLFFGTPIPACIIVLDKEKATTRKGIFMIDASKDFVKDGNKNRLREQDIKKIVDVFKGQLEINGYSKFVSFDEIAQNEYNLNIPRYINSQKEDLQDIKAHLYGGIPDFNIDELKEYFEVLNSVKKDLFKSLKNGYNELKCDIDDIKSVITSSSDFKKYEQEYKDLFKSWRKKKENELKNIKEKPKILIEKLGNEILKHYKNIKLIDKYDIYQVLLGYWNETMQDDVYMISQIGYKVELQEVKNKYICELIPEEILAKKYFFDDLEKMLRLKEEAAAISTELDERIKENIAEDGVMCEAEYLDKDKKKPQKNKVVEYLKKHNEDNEDDEIIILKEYLELYDKKSKKDKELKIVKDNLYEKALKKYKELNENDIKELLVNTKWLDEMESRAIEVMDEMISKLCARIKQIALRYETTLKEIQEKQTKLSKKVDEHLKALGY